MDYRLYRCPICGAKPIEQTFQYEKDKDTYYRYFCPACESKIDSIDYKKAEVQTSVKLPNKELNSEEIYRNSVSKIVQISMTSKVGNSSGTGFIIDDCHIVTNDHVVKNNNGGYDNNWYAISNKDSFYVLELVGHDPALDIAVLKAKPHSFTQKMTLSERKYVAGERCYVIGNAKGSGISIVDGLISDTERQGGNQVTPYIMISAIVEPGNSGGPLIDKYGEVIGVICASRTDATVMHYALPIKIVKQTIERILKA